MNKITFPQYVRTVIEKLAGADYPAYAVGGCVRDSLMGVEPHDWDVCTAATPEQMLEIFPDAIPTGIKHGTMTIRVGEELVETTTFRIDGASTDHRHPKEVRFVNSLEEDLARRDFTINAMAADVNGTISDPFGGKEDLTNKVIRCVGNPEARFAEDALRILRAMRFAARLGFGIEENTAAAMLMQKALIGSLANERIQSELRKMVVGQSIAQILLQFAPVITEFIPEFEECIGFDQKSVWHCYDVWTHIVTTLSYSQPDEITRLALLFHDIGKPECFFVKEGHGHFYRHGNLSSVMAMEIMDRLRFDKETTHRVCELVMLHDNRFDPEKKQIRRLIAKLGVEDFKRLLDIRKSDILAQANYERQVRLDKLEAIKRVTQEVLEEKPIMTVKDLEINGKDLMELGFSEGPKIGEALKFLLENVLDGNIENSREMLLQTVLRAGLDR